MVLKIVTLLAFVSITGCDSIPVRDNPDILGERNKIIEVERNNLKKCIKTRETIDVSINFKLYRSSHGKFGNMTSVTIDPKTSKDNIIINFEPPLENEQEIANCLKKIVRQLEFKSVYPTVQYMESHKYKMKFNSKN